MMYLVWIAILLKCCILAKVSPILDLGSRTFTYIGNLVWGIYKSIDVGSVRINMWSKKQNGSRWNRTGNNMLSRWIVLVTYQSVLNILPNMVITIANSIAGAELCRTQYPVGMSMSVSCHGLRSQRFTVIMNGLNRMTD